MVDEDLLGQGEWPAEAFPPEGDAFIEGAVNPTDQSDGGSSGDSHVVSLTSSGSDTMIA
jgi:hypothetical protein